MGRNKKTFSSSQDSVHGLQHGGSTGNSQSRVYEVPSSEPDITSHSQANNRTEHTDETPQRLRTENTSQNFVRTELNSQTRDNPVFSSFNYDQTFQNFQNDYIQEKEYRSGQHRLVQGQLTDLNKRLDQQREDLRSRMEQQRDQTDLNNQAIADRFTKIDQSMDMLNNRFSEQLGGAIDRLSRELNQKLSVSKDVYETPPMKQRVEAHTETLRKERKAYTQNGDDFASEKSKSDSKKGHQRKFGKKKDYRSRKTTGYTSSSEDNASDTISSSEAESTRTVSMKDYNPVKTVFKNSDTPTQYIQMDDLRPIQKGEDLHFYIQQFENSYCGSLRDQDKIFKLINKLSPVKELYDASFELRRYNSWPHFRNKLLRVKGKQAGDIMREFRRLKQGEDDLLTYFDKLCEKLQHPAAGLPETEIITLVYNKLPYWVQDEVEVYGSKSKLRKLNQLKRAVIELQSDTTRQKIQELDRKFSRLKDQVDGGKPKKPYEENRQTSYSRKPQEELQGKGREKGKTSDSESKKKQYNDKGRTYFVEEEGEQMQNDSIADDNEESNDCQNLAVFQEYETSPSQILAVEERAHPATRAGVQKRKAQEENQEQRQRLSKILEEELNTENSTNQKRSSEKDETQPMESEFPNSADFSQFAQRQMNKGHVEDLVRLRRLQQSNGKEFLIDSDAFFDENGQYDFSLAESNIYQKISLKQLRVWKEQQSLGHATIFHSEVDQPPNSWETYFQHMQEQTQVSQDVVRVRERGQHLLLPMQIEDYKVKALVDTGAQRTIVSRALVEKAGIEDLLTMFTSQFSLRGVAGGVAIISHLQNVQLKLKNQVIIINLPVVESQGFDILIGQDILGKCLRKVCIHVQELQLSYEVTVDGKSEIQTMPLEYKKIQPPQKKEQEKEVKELVQEEVNLVIEDEEVEETFEGISQLEGPYDLVLMDLPIAYPAYHQSKIPYPTQEARKFEILEGILERIMSKNSILLLWCSGKTLTVTLDLIREWKYQFLNFLLVWVKLSKDEQLKLGLGYWTRNNCEFLSMGKKGQNAVFRSDKRDTSQTFFTIFDKPETSQHSSKPVESYTLLERIFDLPNMNCLELFARKKDSSVQDFHFDLYGDEIPGLFQRKTREKFKEQVFYSAQAKDFDTVSIPFLPPEDLSIFKRFVENLNMPEDFKQDRRVVAMLAQRFNAFDCKGRVAEIKTVEFRLRLKPNAAIPESKLVKYDKERRQFLQRFIREQEKKGFVERVKKGQVKCAFSPVVVDKKGSIEKFRACFNFQPLNELLTGDVELILHKGDDVEQIIYDAKKYKPQYIFKLDCKEAHNGVVLAPEDRDWFCIFIEEDDGEGLYRSNRGQFGVQPISKVYIKAMKKAIGWLKEKGVYFYADDVIIFAQSFEEGLYLLDQVLRCLERDGFVVSSKKCEFFKPEMEVLGQVVGNGVVKIAPQKVQAVCELKTPTTKKELQKFIGCLTYVRKFIPNLATLLVPLYDALKGSEIFQLSQTQMEVFRRMKELLTGNQVLKMPEYSRPFFITLTFCNFGYGAALSQKEEGVLRPIFYCSKTQPRSALKPRYVLQLEALARALKDWKQVISGQEIRVITDSSLLKTSLSYNGEDPTLNRLLMKIRLFNPKVEVKPDTFKSLRFSKLLVDDQNYQVHNDLEHLLDEHERELFTRKIPKTEEGRQVHLNFNRYTYTVFFDGACTRQRCSMPVGTYAFVVFNSEEQILKEESGRVEVNDKVTNNLAESFAILKAVEYLQSLNIERFEPMQIIGDSELVIKQLKGQYRINSDPLRAIYRQVKNILRMFKKTTLRNVPREMNTRANDLAQSALKIEVERVLQILSFQVFIVNQENIWDLLICTACGKGEGKEELILCDKCGQGQHKTCLGELLNPAGPTFYCRDCEHYVYNERDFDKKDITRDLLFLDYCMNPGQRMTVEDKQRCERLHKFYRLKDDQLHYFDVDGTKMVPSIPERHYIMLQVHQSLGHVGAANTIRILRKGYYWPNMASDVKRMIQSCLFCKARRDTFLPMPQTFPTYKGLAPWQYVSIDLIVVSGDPLDKQEKESQELYNHKESQRMKYVLSVICAYSKAPELVPIPNRQAKTIRDAFHDQVVCRYGSPIVVRSDGGPEFQGEFKDYLIGCQTRHIITGPYYPQANGLVERLNQTIKQKLQALYNSDEYGQKWAALVQTIAWAIRIQRSRATTFSPFQVMYGRDPLLPGHFNAPKQDNFFEPSLQSITANMEAFLNCIKTQSVKVKEQLEQMNEEIKNTVEAKEIKGLTNLEFGDPILVKQREEPTKLQLEVDGPCTFLRYLDQRRRDMIAYYQPATQRFRTSPICNVKRCSI